MKKRLDIQSLLAKCSKEDIDYFLKAHFKKNKALETEFLIHFAGSFDLEEDQFTAIIHRMEKILPRYSKKINLKAELKLLDYQFNLIEQARDCLYSKNFSQSFIILSQSNKLIEKVWPSMPDQPKIKEYLAEIYRIMYLVHSESPAQALKDKIEKHLLSIIHEDECHISHYVHNPYYLLFQINSVKHGKTLLPAMTEGLKKGFEDRKILLESLCHIICQLKDWTSLVQLLEEYPDKKEVYTVMDQYNKAKFFPSEILSALESNYKPSLPSSIQKQIFHLISSQADQSDQLLNLAIAEYYRTGQIETLTSLAIFKRKPKYCIGKAVKYFKKQSNIRPQILYQLLEELEELDLLKQHLAKEDNIFVFIDHAIALKENEKTFIKNKIWDLTNNHLSQHFGRPAVEWLDQVTHVLIKNNFSYLQDFLFTNIKNNFGHRRHFQKLMKEIA
ncbi:hypothetical protein [Membranihabitans marinus]|uniref:hypothetical protein n=1 Tax=Membranihabitans marinus TaxID=1227546 RepID=UPI001F2D918C|nr:hypothetical protein [Membranihabitans marinus]